MRKLFINRFSPIALLTASVVFSGCGSNVQPSGIQGEQRLTAQGFTNPNDPFFPQQANFFGSNTANTFYAQYRMNILDAWQMLPPTGLKLGGGRPTIAVIDSGWIRVGDPEMESVVLWDDSKDFVTDSVRSLDGDGRDSKGEDEVSPLKSCKSTSGLNSSGEYYTSGHGMKMASIIGAAYNNGIGMTGVVPNAQILALRTISCGSNMYEANLPDEWVMKDPTTWKTRREKGQQEIEDLADAINYAVAYGVDVINISQNFILTTGYNPSVPGTYTVESAFLNACNLRSGPGSSQMADLRNAFINAYNRNIPIFVAASNDNKDMSVHVLNSCPGAIPVTAVSSRGEKQSYSNFTDMGKRGWDFGVAVDVDDAVIQNYYRDTTGVKYQTLKIGSGVGTSGATAYASGVAALMKMVNPGLTVARLHNMMVYNGSIIDPKRSPGTVTCLAVNYDLFAFFMDWNRAPGVLRKTCGYSVLNASNAVYRARFEVVGTDTVNYIPSTIAPRDPSADPGTYLNPIFSPGGGL